MNPDVATDNGHGSSRFDTTRWSLIFSSLGRDSEETQAHEALSHICRIYWRPIFAFVCRRGVSIDDAEDLTQDFFVMVLQGNLLHRADPARGRFRSLLLKALQNFLIDAHNKRRTKKRGGEVNFVAWDDWMSEAPSQLRLSPHALESWSPERIFDVRWAATIVERALARLREECEGRGRRRVFDFLSGHLSAERADVNYLDLGKQLGIEPVAVKRLVHQMRLRYRDLLRQEVAETVAKPEDVDDELRYLCAVLAARANK